MVVSRSKQTGEQTGGKNGTKVHNLCPPAAQRLPSLLVQCAPLARHRPGSIRGSITTRQISDTAWTRHMSMRSHPPYSFPFRDSSLGRLICTEPHTSVLAGKTPEAPLPFHRSYILRHWPRAFHGSRDFRLERLTCIEPHTSVIAGKSPKHPRFMDLSSSGFGSSSWNEHSWVCRRRRPECVVSMCSQGPCLGSLRCRFLP